MDQDLVQKAFESMKVVDIMDIPTDTTKLKTEMWFLSFQSLTSLSMYALLMMLKSHQSTG